MERMAVLVGLLGAAFLSVTAADAAPAAFKNHLIVPNKSVAGIRLNTSYAAARRAFPNSGCSTVHGCDLRGANGSDFNVQFASTNGSPSSSERSASRRASRMGCRSSKRR